MFRDCSTWVVQYLDGVAKDEMCHHGITHKDHAADQAEVDEVRACQGQGTGHHTQAGLEVHALQHPPDEQQNVNAIEGIVPGQLVDQVLQLSKGGLQLKEEDAVLVQPQEGGFGLEIGVHIVPVGSALSEKSTKAKDKLLFTCRKSCQKISVHC